MSDGHTGLSEDALSRARAGDEDAFRELIDPYRRELQLHCHRILGSLQDVEDHLPGSVHPGSGASDYVEAGIRVAAGVRAFSSCARELISSLR
jgi:hypothetical protein